MGLNGLEPSTSPLSAVRSSQLSYKPEMSPPFEPGGTPSIDRIDRIVKAALYDDILLFS